MSEKSQYIRWYGAGPVQQATQTQKVPLEDSKGKPQTNQKLITKGQNLEFCNLCNQSIKNPSAGQIPHMQSTPSIPKDI